ncbi:hypothetical protein [Rhodopirellula halodulae]|uniref:hypothetical protein n=1 Tax=Rhodopirellula halodulae TaxID=2894198 RepID=UPI001E452CBD|nr:hypothetical protein [Rhodopirellula sp. JC737]MCC9656167.1 hypothetical protein [Rhodopirellula sp. JC737]
MNWLLHQWIVAGLVSSAARFVPIPFVDDVIQDQCRRYVVARTLEAHDRSDLKKELRAYHSSDAGCVAGCLGMLAKAPLKLILFPIRKIVALFTSVRGVPLEVIRTILLGRTLDRMLRDEVLGKTVSTQQVLAMRESFNIAFARMDFRVARAAMSDALANVQDWKESAKDMATSLSGDQSHTPSEDQLQGDKAINESAERVEEALRQPELVKLFAEFDQRFDEAYQDRSIA